MSDMPPAEEPRGVEPDDIDAGALLVADVTDTDFVPFIDEAVEVRTSRKASARTSTRSTAKTDLRAQIGVVTKPRKGPKTRPRRVQRKSKFVRRVSGSLAILFALVALGFAYQAFLPGGTSSAADNSQVAEGQRLYQNSCIACHGANLQGVVGRAPSLVGVGQAAVYFQVGTGRMPATGNGAQEPRKTPVFDEDQIDALAAYVQSIGGGPVVPAVQSDGTLQDKAELAKGGELYRLNCASCHNFTGQGGALSQGKYAPNLDEATDQQIYAAMLSGPENMPKFGDGTLSDSDKRAIIAFVQNNKATVDPGGYSLGGFGPAPEGLIAFLVGMGAIVALIMWMGSRA